MRNFLKSCACAFGRCLEVAVSVVGIVMLLSFPANASHHFDAHFRSNEVRSSIVRHAIVAGPEADDAQTIVHIDSLPSVPAQMIIQNSPKLVTSFDSSGEVSLFRLLQRFKLGPSRSGGPDPLL